MAIILCSISDCFKPHKAKGLCAMHYRRLLIHGDPNKVLALRTSKGASLEERFWSKVAKTDSCWVWLGYKNPEGYGIFRVGDKTTKAHRWAKANSGEVLVEGLEVHHKCFNPPCVRPDHLEQVTQMRNSQERSGANRNSKSGVRGLVWYPQTGRWLASYGFEGKRYKKYFLPQDKDTAIAWLETNRGKHLC